MTLRSLIKTLVLKSIERFGYNLLPKNSYSATLPANFTTLCKAVEFHLAKDWGKPIPPNSLRFQLLSRQQGTPAAEAYYLIQALNLTSEIEGDVCEFGVAQGETSTLIANEISCTTKVLHLFDTFEGLPMPSESDILKDDIYHLGDIKAYKGYMAFSESNVLSRLNQLGFPSNRYRLHRGLFSATSYPNPSFPTRVSFAYIDFDFHDPILAALNFLDQVLSPGGIVIVDDYDFFSTGVKTACDNFILKMNSEKIRYKIHTPDPDSFGHFTIITRSLE